MLKPLIFMPVPNPITNNGNPQRDQSRHPRHAESFPGVAEEEAGDTASDDDEQKTRVNLDVLRLDRICRILLNVGHAET